MGFKHVNGFLNDFKLKKDKEELLPILAENLVEVEDYYFRKGHKDRETVDRLFDKMESKKFFKCLKALFEEGALDEGVPVIITNFIERRGDKEGGDEYKELIEKYIKLVNKLVKDKVKELVKETGIDKDVAKEVIVVVPGEDYINDKFVGIYVNRVCKKLYALAKDNTVELSSKQLKKMFKYLFKEELIYDAAVQVLLEKREVMKNFNESQLGVWNTLTEFALKTLNKLDKQELKAKILRYCERRNNDENDVARRIVLSQIDPDEYPTLSKVVGKLKEKEEDLAKYL